MIDNVLFGPESGVNHGLALLRAQSIDKPVRPKVDLVPGIFLSIDPDATVTGTLSSAPGEILSLRVNPEGSTRWISIHLQMGGADLRQVQMLGVVCRSRAPQAMTFRMVLRSGIEGGFVDTAFRKTTVSYAEPSVHMDVLDLTREPAIPRQSGWREIILMFDHTAFDLNLLNFGVFTV